MNPTLQLETVGKANSTEAVKCLALGNTRTPAPERGLRRHSKKSPPLCTSSPDSCTDGSDVTNGNGSCVGVRKSSVIVGTVNVANRSGVRVGNVKVGIAHVGVGVGVLVGRGVGDGVAVGVFVGRGVGVGVGTGTGVAVAVGTGEGVGDGVGVLVGTGLGVGVAVGAGVLVGTGTTVGISDGVGVFVAYGRVVGVGNGTGVHVATGVQVGIGVQVGSAVGVHVGSGVHVGATDAVGAAGPLQPITRPVAATKPIPTATAYDPNRRECLIAELIRTRLPNIPSGCARLRRSGSAYCLGACRQLRLGTSLSKPTDSKKRFHRLLAPRRTGSRRL